MGMICMEMVSYQYELDCEFPNFFFPERQQDTSHIWIVFLPCESSCEYLDSFLLKTLMDTSHKRMISFLYDFFHALWGWSLRGKHEMTDI